MVGPQLRPQPDGEILGMSMKTLSLITLTIQNSALILILYYSRVMPLVGGKRYITSTAVFLNEILKLFVCSTAALYEISDQVAPASPATALATKIFAGDGWKLMVPATFYTLQNLLQYVAISHLDAATLQVTYQFKILPTAVFSVLILGRSLSARQWTALGLLMFGVAIVQLPVASNTSSVSDHSGQSRWMWLRAPSLSSLRGSHLGSKHEQSASYESTKIDHPRSETVGLFAALGACTVSALGSVYFESIVKHANTKVGIWVRNCQLSFYSLFPAFFIGIIFIDGEAIAKNGFLTGYNWVVWAVIGFQAMGGIIVALCVYYADTVTKSFATSISILLSLVLSMILFDFNLSINFLVGTALVLYATYLYNANGQRRRTSSIRLPEHEKTSFDQSFAAKLSSTPSKEAGHRLWNPASPSLHHTRSGGLQEYFAVKKD